MKPVIIIINKHANFNRYTTKMPINDIPNIKQIIPVCSRVAKFMLYVTDVVHPLNIRSIVSSLWR